ncbi:hypothetical protein AX14_001352 [Amanita brunnescens Koide BX004]|nr:hypothetical protein AX14_001352 [Amanita brunnescens Koide BX004]
MLARISALVSALAIAAPIASAVPTYGGGSCNVGTVHCCNSIQNSHSQQVETLAGQDVDLLRGLTGNVGLGCTVIGAVGLGGNSCSAQPACCSNNKINGLITVDCSPINVHP